LSRNIAILSAIFLIYLARVVDGGAGTALHLFRPTRNSTHPTARATVANGRTCLGSN
jgi:hypothetical protein